MKRVIKASVGRKFYFGDEASAKYGDLIAEKLSGKTVSKRKSTAKEPGGLIYEANKLGIDMWDLLEALEGMCYEGRAQEIDDSTYRINGRITASDSASKNTVTTSVKINASLRPGYYANQIFSILDSLSVDQIERFLNEYAAWRDFDVGSISDIYDRIGAYLETSSGQQLFGDLSNYFEIDAV